MSSRNYSDRTLKILWGRAAARCAMPECRIELVADDSDSDRAAILGDIAHMAASSDSGPRANRALADSDRDEYDNLILLCKNCHAKFDVHVNKYSAQEILNIKELHEEWVRRSLPERGLSATGWTTITLEDHAPVDHHLVVSALAPDFAAGEIVRVRIEPTSAGWDAATNQIRRIVAEIFSGQDKFSSRLAIFPLAAVSACIALGFEITNRPRVRLYQYHRDDTSWNWPQGENCKSTEVVTASASSPSHQIQDVAFCFHLSAAVSEQSINEVLPGPRGVVNFTVPKCSTGWLRHRRQLAQLGQIARQEFESAVENFPSAKNWHIFYCGPAPGAVVVGQQLNRTMSASVRLYEFQRTRTPQYHESMTLTA